LFGVWGPAADVRTVGRREVRIVVWGTWLSQASMRVGFQVIGPIDRPSVRLAASDPCRRLGVVPIRGTSDYCS
jgi:hypothetical protein